MVLSEGHQPIPYGVADLVRLGDVLLSRRHVRGVGKSMNFAGVPAIRETRYRIRSRGLVFLALAMQHRSVRWPSDAHLETPRP